MAAALLHRRLLATGQAVSLLAILLLSAAAPAVLRRSELPTPVPPAATAMIMMIRRG
jgi:hypothetical protein